MDGLITIYVLLMVFQSYQDDEKALMNWLYVMEPNKLLFTVGKTFPPVEDVEIGTCGPADQL